MLEWKDVTSYSKGDTERKPRVLECELAPGITIRVHKHIAWGEEFLLTSRKLEFDCTELNTADLEEAKAVALDRAYHRLTHLHEVLTRALRAIDEEQMGE